MVVEKLAEVERENLGSLLDVGSKRSSKGRLTTVVKNDIETFNCPF